MTIRFRGVANSSKWEKWLIFSLYRTKIHRKLTKLEQKRSLWWSSVKTEVYTCAPAQNDGNIQCFETIKIRDLLTWDGKTKFLSCSRNHIIHIAEDNKRKSTKYPINSVENNNCCVNASIVTPDTSRRGRCQHGECHLPNINKTINLPLKSSNCVN